MAQYVCKILDRHARQLRLVPVTADSDRDAINRAILLQLVTSLGAGFQVWTGTRLVMSFQNHRPAWRTEPANTARGHTSLRAASSRQAAPEPPAH